MPKVKHAFLTLTSPLSANACKLPCMKTLAERINARMTVCEIEPVALAKAAGTTRQAVYQWMNGETKTLRGETLVKAARALKTTPEWLGSGKGEMVAKPGSGSNGLSPAAIEVAEAWMRLPDYKQRGYAQGIMVDAAVVGVFPEIERAMQLAAVATDPNYHKLTEKFTRARELLKRQLELDLKGDS